MSEDINELLKKLQEAFSNNDNEEVSFHQEEKDGVNIISIQRRPAGEAEWYQDESGFIIDWKEKFKREAQESFPPFKPGEKVYVSGFVEPDPNGLYKFHVDADGRCADNFFISEDFGQLADHAGMPLEAIVEVTQHRNEGFMISDIWNYDAKLSKVVAVPAVNPTEEEAEELSSGKRVVIKGRFAHFTLSGTDRFLESRGFPPGSSIGGEESTSSKGIHKVKLTIVQPDGTKVEHRETNPPESYHDKETAALITTPEGKVIDIKMPTGRIKFSDGVLENIRRKSPIGGDFVKIGAFITQDKRFAAHWCDPCYLDKPSPDRLANYTDLRAHVKSEIEGLKATIGLDGCEHATKQISENEHLKALELDGYEHARRCIGDVRALELTADELAQIREITQSMPKSERPVQTPVSKHNPTGKRDSWISTIDDSYNIRLEAMTEQEFVEFADAAVTGRIKPGKKHTDQSYFFGLAKDHCFDLDTDTQERLIVNCIETRLPRVRGKPYNHKAHFEDKYNVEQAFKYLAGLGTETGTQMLFDLLFDMTRKSEYRETNWREKEEPRTRSFIYPVAAALDMHRMKIPLNILLGNIRKFKETYDILAEKSDESIALDQMERVMQHAESKLGEM